MDWFGNTDEFKNFHNSHTVMLEKDWEYLPIAKE